MIKMLFQYFKDNVQAKTRIHRIYCINAGSGVCFNFGLLRTFFSDMLFSRIYLSGQVNLSRLFNHCNSGQVEFKYGGNAQDMKNDFWPPKVPNDNFLNRFSHNRLDTP